MGRQALYPPVGESHELGYLWHHSQLWGESERMLNQPLFSSVTLCGALQPHVPNFSECFLCPPWQCWSLSSVKCLGLVSGCRLGSQKVSHMLQQDHTSPLGINSKLNCLRRKQRAACSVNGEISISCQKKESSCSYKNHTLVKRGSSAVVLLVKGSMISKKRCCLASTEVQLSSHLFSLLYSVGGLCLAWNKIHRIRKANFVDLMYVS